MTTPDENSPSRPSEPRTMRWLLGGQIGLAVLMVVLDLGPTLPALFSGTDAPDLTQPIQPGDQRRRFDPANPTRPSNQTDPNMPRRMTLTPLSESDQTGVSLRGEIAPGDGARIAADLRANPPAFVALDSPGGSVTDALTIGQTLRALGSNTRIAQDAICFSACPYIFVGGTQRVIDGAGQFGVHQHSFGESTILPTFLAAEDIQRGQAAVLDHLVEMGIDLRLMGPALATPANEIYILTSDELRDWKVVTE